MGMVYKVAAPDEYMSLAEQIATQLSQMPTLALARTKALLNASYQNDLSAQLALEDKYQTECGQSYDYQEGTAAFLQKRKPEFKGE